MQESGQDIMGLSADDLRNLEQSESDFSLAVQAATFKQLLFKLKIAEENYNDENRIKMSVVRYTSISLASAAKCTEAHTTSYRLDCLASAPAGMAAPYAFGCHSALHLHLYYVTAEVKQ